MKDYTRAEVEGMLAGATPGQWHARRRTVAHVLSDGYGDGGYVSEACFVEPMGLQVYGPDWQHNRECSGKGSDFICANARLIAAAPDLARQLLAALDRVEALEGALETADSCLTEAEAILGGEYGDHYGPLCEEMLVLRNKIADLGGSNE